MHVAQKQARLLDQDRLNLTCDWPALRQFRRRLGRSEDRLEVPVDLLAEKPGTAPIPVAGSLRDYRRHWTPVHLDWPVAELDAAVGRAQAAGATLEGGIREKKWGRLAILADPFGNGFCLLEFRGRGYDELIGS